MDYPRLKVIEHSLARHKLALMRDAACEAAKFRSLAYELGLLLCSEGARTLPLEPWEGVSVEGRAVEGQVLDQWGVVVVPILRGGLVLAEGFFELLPAARNGHIGIYHDYNTQSINTYLVALPDVKRVSKFLIVDCLMGTGLSAIEAVNTLKKYGAADESISFFCLSAHEQGIESLYKNPDTKNIDVYTFEICYNLHNNRPDFGFGSLSDRLLGTDM